MFNQRPAAAELVIKASTEKREREVDVKGNCGWMGGWMNGWMDT